MVFSDIIILIQYVQRKKFHARATINASIHGMYVMIMWTAQMARMKPTAHPVAAQLDNGSVRTKSVLWKTGSAMALTTVGITRMKSSVVSNLIYP